jgi:hypothetical protein
MTRKDREKLIVNKLKKIIEDQKEMGTYKEELVDDEMFNGTKVNFFNWILGLCQGAGLVE